MLSFRSLTNILDNIGLGHDHCKTTLKNRHLIIHCRKSHFEAYQLNPSNIDLRVFLFLNENVSAISNATHTNLVKLQHLYCIVPLNL